MQCGVVCCAGGVLPWGADGAHQGQAAGRSGVGGAAGLAGGVTGRSLTGAVVGDRAAWGGVGMDTNPSVYGLLCRSNQMLSKASTSASTRAMETNGVL